MNYVWLAIAIVSEVIGTSSLKACAGFTRLWPSVVVLLSYSITFYFFSLTLKTIPIGIAYALWAGAGTVLIALIGFFFYRQKLDAPAITGMALIVAGILVMNLFSKSAAQ
jgi:small multidrug resistance pump